MTIVTAPLPGRAIGLGAVPDPVFMRRDGGTRDGHRSGPGTR